MKLRKYVVAFSLAIATMLTGVLGSKLEVNATAVNATVDMKYFSTLTQEELKEVTDTAVDMQYNHAYELPAKADIDYNYKFTVTQRGYITITANNPYKEQWDGLLKTMMSVVDTAGNSIWMHNYDYGNEAVENHSYKIGLNPGTYYFRVYNRLYNLKNTTENMKYSFVFTADDYFEVEPNNVKEVAVPYILGTTMSGEYASHPWTYWSKGMCDDYFKMDLVKECTYLFKIDMYSEGLNNQDFRLEDSTGEKIFDNWDLKDGTYTYKCPATGTYYLRFGCDLVSAAGIVQPYSFSVNEKKITSPATTISKVTVKKKSAVIKWKKKSGVTGYQLQYGTSKSKISKGKKVTIKGASKTSKTIKKLKKGKIYYFRVRTYTKADGKTVYSKWSSVKKSKKIK